MYIVELFTCQYLDSYLIILFWLCLHYSMNILDILIIHWWIPFGIQVHITQGDLIGKAVFISWTTPSKPGSSVVQYGLESGKYSYSKKGKVLTYTFYNYTSGFIHHCRIDNLKVCAHLQLVAQLLLIRLRTQRLVLIDSLLINVWTSSCSLIRNITTS
mgnify:CR=1 FL=1